VIRSKAKEMERHFVEKLTSAFAQRAVEAR